MVEVRAGNEIPVSGAVKGTSNKGEYFKVIVKAEKGYDKIDVWATNPKEAMGIVGMAKIAGIASAKVTAHQYNGKWYTDYVVEAKLVQGAAEEPAFLIPEDVDDAELPF